MVLYRIEGGGYTWPNGLQYLPEKILGKVCRDLNGSEVICRQTSEVFETSEVSADVSLSVP